MAVVRTARAVWHGDLNTGSGEVSSGTSQQFQSLPVTWPSRTEDAQGRTSPEELLAAAHAACFSMAFSSNLTKAGSPPEQLEVTVDITFDKREAGWTVASSAIRVNGRVPGIDAGAFATAAEGAKENCPISRALKGNVEMTVDATLDG